MDAAVKRRRNISRQCLNAVISLYAGAELLRCAQEEELAQDSDISADTSDIAAEASEAAVAGQRKSGKKRSKFIDLRALSFWMKLN